MKDFDLLKVLGTGAYGKVFLVRKIRGPDRGQLYAMKVLKKANIVQKKKTTEHTRTERQVLETIRQAPFLVTMHYAFQTPAKLHLVLGRNKIFLRLSISLILIFSRLCKWGRIVYPSLPKREIQRVRSANIHSRNCFSFTAFAQGKNIF